MSERSFLRLPDVIRRVGVSRPMIYRWIQQGVFPAPLRPYPTTAMVCWPSDEIDRWIAERVAATHTRGANKASARTPT